MTEARTRAAWSVHPHACGDFGGKDYLYTTEDGTPPRVWGLLQDINLLSEIDRYTPTRVGTSCSRPMLPSLPPVHPHACGDFADVRWITAIPGGTPPRVWGLRNPSKRIDSHRRYTPTRVGTSPTLWVRLALRSVHPHACGDFEICGHFARTRRGTPPRVWGLR